MLQSVQNIKLKTQDTIKTRVVQIYWALGHGEIWGVWVTRIYGFGTFHKYQLYCKNPMSKPRHDLAYLYHVSSNIVVILSFDIKRSYFSRLQKLMLEGVMRHPSLQYVHKLYEGISKQTPMKIRLFEENIPQNTNIAQLQMYAIIF